MKHARALVNIPPGFVGTVPVYCSILPRLFGKKRISYCENLVVTQRIWRGVIYVTSVKVNK